MIEIYKREVPLSAWCSYLVNTVEPIAHKTYQNRYAKLGFTAEYHVIENTKEPWNGTVSFSIHAPDDAHEDAIKGLQKSLNDNYALWEKREAEKAARATQPMQR